MAAPWAAPLLSTIAHGQTVAVPNQWLYMTGPNLGEGDVRGDDLLEALAHDSDDEEQGRAIVSVKKFYRLTRLG